MMGMLKFMKFMTSSSRKSKKTNIEISQKIRNWSTKRINFYKKVSSSASKEKGGDEYKRFILRKKEMMYWLTWRLERRQDLPKSRSPE